MLMMPMLLALSPIKADHNLKNITLLIFALILIIFIGLRHEVGGDWARYLDITNSLAGVGGDFTQGSGEIGYKFVQQISVDYFNGIYTSNLICAVFFVFGLIRLSRNTPMPWVALLVATPFLITVVSLGYTRQAAAIGFLMWGLVDLMNGKYIYFIIAVLIGALFHVTVMVMIAIPLLYKGQGKIVILLASPLLYLIYLNYQFQINFMIYHYITIEIHHSSGSIARLFVGFVSAALFFLYQKKMRKKYNDWQLWLVFSIINAVLFPASFFYSTVIDRFSIYFIPLQMIVLSRVPGLILSRYNRTIFILFIIFFYFFMLTIWLFFGKNSHAWIPYQNFLTSII